jgi:hypothetical protein
MEKRKREIGRREGIERRERSGGGAGGGREGYG